MTGAPSRWKFFAAAGLVAAAVGLRLYQWTFFEFKFDQAANLLGGIDALKHHLLIDHALESTVGLPNPPLFFQVCGVLSLVSTTPAWFAGATLAFGIAALAMLYPVLKKPLGEETAMLAVLIAGCVPFILFLSSDLWQQVYLPLFVPPLLWGLARDDRVGWAVAALAATFSGMIHMSGFFLGPGLLWLAWKRKVGLRTFLTTAAAAFLLLSPWLCRLCFEWDRRWLPADTGPAERPLTLLWETLGMFGPGFLREYFGRDMVFPAARFVGAPAAWLLAAGSALPIWAGVMNAVRHRREAPEIVRVSLILAGSVLAGYFLTLLHVYFFYMYLPSLLLAVAAAYGFSRMAWRPRHILLGTWFICALALTGLTQGFLDRSGGHPREYGPSYGFWRDVRREIAEISSGRPVRLQIRTTDAVRNKMDRVAVWYLLREYFDSKDGVPLTLLIDYDAAAGHYVRRWEVSRR